MLCSKHLAWNEKEGARFEILMVLSMLFYNILAEKTHNIVRLIC